MTVHVIGKGIKGSKKFVHSVFLSNCENYVGLFVVSGFKHIQVYGSHGKSIAELCD